MYSDNFCTLFFFFIFWFYFTFFFLLMYGKRSFGDAFTSEVSEKVVSIIAKEVGFEAIQPAALESLSNSLGSCKFIKWLLNFKISFVLDLERLLIKAHLYAELGNRARPNIHDITKSLQDANVDIPSFEKYLADKTHLGKFLFLCNTWKEGANVI